MADRGSVVESIRREEGPSPPLTEPRSGVSVEDPETVVMCGDNHGDVEDSYLDISGDRTHLLGWSTVETREGGVLTRARARLAEMAHPPKASPAESELEKEGSEPTGIHSIEGVSSEGIDFCTELLHEQQSALFAGRVQLEEMVKETDVVRSKYHDVSSRMSLLNEEALKASSDLQEMHRLTVEAKSELQQLESDKARTILETEAIEESTASTARCRWLETEIEALRKNSGTALATAKSKLDSIVKEKDTIESHFRGCVAANRGFEKSNSELRDELKRISISHSEKVASQQSQFGDELEGLRHEHKKILDQRAADEEARSRDAEKERLRLEENVRRQKEETAGRILKDREDTDRAELARLEVEEDRWHEMTQRRKTLDKSHAAEIQRLKQLNLQLEQQSEVDRKEDVERVSAGVRKELQQHRDLKERSDVAVALARSEHDEQIRKLRIERQGLVAEVPVEHGVEGRRREYLALIDLGRSRDLTLAEYARYEELYEDMAREERRLKSEADVKAMTARVAQLTSQYEAQLAQPLQSSRGGGTSRGTGRGLDEVGSIESIDLNVGAGEGIREGGYQLRAEHTHRVSRELESGGVGQRRYDRGSFGGNVSKTTSSLGMDVEVRSGESRAVQQTRRHTELLHRAPLNLTPARRRAIETPPFGGQDDWVTWYRYFSQDQITDGADRVQQLANLKNALRKGPAKDVVWGWEECGDGTLEGLAQACAEHFGADRADPVAALERRRQGKSEGLRIYGLALKRLATEAYPSVDMTVDWVITKINQLFIRGLYDPELAKDLSAEWRTWMSLAQLMDAGEELMRKRRLLVGLPGRPSGAGQIMGVSTPIGEPETDDPGTADVAAYGGRYDSSKANPSKDKKAKSGKSKSKPKETDDSTTVTLEQLQQAMAKLTEMVGNQGSRSRGPRAADARCWNCKKFGHFERDCKSPIVSNNNKSEN